MQTFYAVKTICPYIISNIFQKQITFTILIIVCLER